MPRSITQSEANEERERGVCACNDDGQDLHDIPTCECHCHCVEKGTCTCADRCDCKCTCATESVCVSMRPDWVGCGDKCKLTGCEFECGCPGGVECDCDCHYHCVIRGDCRHVEHHD